MLAVAAVGCGSGGTTTVIEEAPTEAAKPADASDAKLQRIENETEEAELEAAEAKKEAAQQAAQAKKEAAQAQAEAAKQQRAAARAKAKAEAQEAAQVEEEVSAEPPNVVGMRLPAAEAELSAAGFSTVAENTDTTFGILVPSHYTVCEESKLAGDSVRVLAQKYGC